MFLTHWRRSKAFRIASAALLLHFSTSQNLYGQEFHIQEGTSLDTPGRAREGTPRGAWGELKGLKEAIKVFVALTPQSVALTPQNAIFFEIFLELVEKKPYFEARTKMKSDQSYKEIGRIGLVAI